MPNFGIGDVGRYYKTTYSLLQPGDKQLVWSLLKTIFACIAIAYLAILVKKYTNTPIPEIIPEHAWEYVSFGLEVLIILITGVLAALLFTLFDRLSVITPMEKNIRQMMKHSMTQAEQLSGYNKYVNARTDFGLSGIMATTTKSSAAKLHIDEARMDSAVIALFDKCESGCSIDYMNSFVNSDQEYYNAILSAVKNGVHFRMMLMLPDESTSATQSRFKDYQIPHCRTIADFVEYITQKYRHFDSLRNEVTAIRKLHKEAGTFDIRYYSDSLNFPLVIIDPKVADCSRPETVAYTGFYAGVSSESMPYVEWMHGEFDMVASFKSLFKKKWAGCGKKSYLFPENAPKV